MHILLQKGCFRFPAKKISFSSMQQSCNVYNSKCALNKKASETRSKRFWGYNSVGRVPALQAGRQEFESPYLHFRSQLAISQNLVIDRLLHCDISSLECVDSIGRLQFLILIKLQILVNCGKPGCKPFSVLHFHKLNHPKPLTLRFANNNLSQTLRVSTRKVNDSFGPRIE